MFLYNYFVFLVKTLLCLVVSVYTYKCMKLANLSLCNFLILLVTPSLYCGKILCSAPIQNVIKLQT